MTTETQKLEKQKEELLNSLTQISKDPSVPMSEKLPVIKELSRAIANITEQINKILAPQLRSSPVGSSSQVPQAPQQEK
jgi:hypothetical protein